MDTYPRKYCAVISQPFTSATAENRDSSIVAALIECGAIEVVEFGADKKPTPVVPAFTPIIADDACQI